MCSEAEDGDDHKSCQSSVKDRAISKFGDIDIKRTLRLGMIVTDWKEGELSLAGETVERVDIELKNKNMK